MGTKKERTGREEKRKKEKRGRASELGRSCPLTLRGDERP